MPIPDQAPKLAKLSRPRLHAASHRTRLYELLDRGRTTGPGVWVTGPPGAGKTSVVATWLEVRAIVSIWYQVDAGDADLAGFFHYLSLAAAPFTGRLGTRLPALTPEYLQDVRGFSRRFFRTLFGALPDGAALVLDNYQEVPQREAFHQLVADAVDEVPPGGALLVISRIDAPEPFARLFLNERIAQITWEDLRLSLDEARIIGHAMGLRSLSRIEHLHQQSDGWAAGLTLLLERTPDDAGAQPRHEPMQGRLFDYFASQVFDSLDPQLRAFLARTAVLPAVQVPVAQALTGVDHAGALLEQLYAKRLFIHRRCDSPPGYQYHALFRDFLRKRLLQEAGETSYRQLAVRAADLLSTNGQLEEAVALYQDAGAWAQAERCAIQLAPQLLSAGRGRSLQDWLAALPEQQRTGSPWALYWLGMSRLPTDPPAARDELVRANELFIAGDDIVGRLLSSAAIIRSHHFEYNTFEDMDRWMQRIEADLVRGEQRLDAADGLAVHSAALLVAIYRQPGNPMRSRSIDRITQLLDTLVDVNQRMSAAFVLLLAHTQAHENTRAAHLVARLQPLVDDASVTALNRAYWWMLVGYLQHRRGDREATERALDLADRIAGEHGLRQPEFLSRCFRAQHHCSWSDAAGAVRALSGLEGMLSSARPMAVAQYHKQCFFLEMVRGNAAAAASHAREGVAAAARLGAPFFEVAWMSQGAAALALSGAYDEAASWLETSWSLTDLGFLRSYRPMVLASRAFLAAQRGRDAESRAILREMFSMCADADAFSYVGTVPVVREFVLREALAAGIHIPVVQFLIRKYRVSPLDPDLDDWPFPIRIYTLGEFRIEIDGRRVQFARKTPRKALLLLKALIAMGGRAVAQHRLIDALWPEEDGDLGLEALGASLYRLRKLLGSTSVIELKEGVLSIDPSQVWVDVQSLERLVRDLRPAALDLATTQRVSALYRGPFLDEDLDTPWAITVRERVREGYLRYLLRAGRHLEEAGDFEAAARLYRTGILADELAEDLYQGLMRALDANGRSNDALMTYARLSRVLGERLAKRPSTLTRQLFEQIQRHG